MEKDEALNIIFQCADLYEKNLKNNNLLFVCANGSMKITMLETLFLSSNFLHLTGVKFEEGKVISANAFYSLCLDRRLKVDDFELDSTGTTEMKLTVLPHLMTKNIGANMVGDFTAQRKTLYTEKIAGNIRGALGFVFDADRSTYMPNTSLQEDVRRLTMRQLRVIATYRKTVDAPLYEEIVYEAKKVKWDKVIFPKGYEYLPKPEVKPVNVISKGNAESEITIENSLTQEQVEMIDAYVSSAQIFIEKMHMDIESAVAQLQVPTDIREAVIEHLKNGANR